MFIFHKHDDVIIVFSEKWTKSLIIIKLYQSRLYYKRCSNIFYFVIVYSMTFKNTWFTYSSFTLNESDLFSFRISEHIVYMYPTNIAFEEILKDPIWYYDWKYWRITVDEIIDIVWSSVVHWLQTIKWFLIVNTDNYFYIFNSDLKLLFESEWELFDIFKENKKWYNGWLSIWIWEQRYLYSTRWWLINVTEQVWRIMNDFVVIYDNNYEDDGSCSCFDTQWHKILSGVTTIYYDENDYIVFMDKENNMWCCSFRWTTIFSCEYDHIDISYNYVIAQKGKKYTVHHRYEGKILEWEYDTLIVQWWYIITQQLDKYVLYWIEWKKICTWREFMYIDTTWIIHTGRKNDNKIRKVNIKPPLYFGWPFS